LSEYELRDIHDEINKQMREKRHWADQIVALGGITAPAGPSRCRMTMGRRCWGRRRVLFFAARFSFFLPMRSP
ncbi:hypothetical protein K438DRAFT_1644500, partial [Mycena galopus ATCC 62051]